MAAGGKRAGAGRPKGSKSGKSGRESAALPLAPSADPETPATYPDVESYLAAVVEGRASPDPLRITAAKTLIQYQRARQRAPVASPPPSQLAHRNAITEENALAKEFERRAEAIRARHSKK